MHSLCKVLSGVCFVFAGICFLIIMRLWQQGLMEDTIIACFAFGIFSVSGIGCLIIDMVIDCLHDIQETLHRLAGDPTEPVKDGFLGKQKPFTENMDDIDEIVFNNERDAWKIDAIHNVKTAMKVGKLEKEDGEALIQRIRTCTNTKK